MSKPKMIAFCGLACTDCPAHIAKRTDDAELRRKTAEEWSTAAYRVGPSDVNCDGCIGDGKELFRGWCPACPVRKCGQERAVENCAHCADYPCDKLYGLWKMLKLTTARSTLDEIRRTHLPRGRSSSRAGQGKTGS